jgi:hypothetical protein
MHRLTPKLVQQWLRLFHAVKQAGLVKGMRNTRDAIMAFPILSRLFFLRDEPL